MRYDYAKQEQTVFGDIAKARSALLSAGNPQEKIAANQQLDGALGRLLVVVENYPQLKSNENFLRLQDELAGTENRIAVERKRYNDTLQDYNTYIQQFPTNGSTVPRVMGRRCDRGTGDPHAATSGAGGI